MSESPEQIQKNILELSQSAAQRQAKANEELKRQGKALKTSDKNLNELNKDRINADKDLNHIKKNQNVFKRFLLDYCCCCQCCQCCRKCCEEKTEPVVMAITTESEEPDPDEDTVNKLWTQRYEPKTWQQQVDDNLRRLQEDAEECERELNKQNKLIAKIDTKSKTQTKGLEKSTQKMKGIIN